MKIILKKDYEVRLKIDNNRSSKLEGWKVLKIYPEDDGDTWNNYHYKSCMTCRQIFKKAEQDYEKMKQKKIALDAIYADNVIVGEKIVEPFYIQELGINMSHPKIREVFNVLARCKRTNNAINEMAYVDIRAFQDTIADLQDNPDLQLNDNQATSMLNKLHLKLEGLARYTRRLQELKNNDYPGAADKAFDVLIVESVLNFTGTIALIRENLLPRCSYKIRRKVDEEERRLRNMVNPQNSLPYISSSSNNYSITRYRTVTAAVTYVNQAQNQNDDDGVECKTQ